MTSVDGRQIVFAPQAMQECEEHCFSRVDVEVGGFLLGEVTDHSVEVRAVHPAAAAESRQTNLTFTHEAWDEILSKLDSEYSGLSIVGWYHSHPGFGCFLSEYDIFIQENFFSGPGQTALVIDPLAGQYGVFTAAGGHYTEIESGSTSRAAIAEPDEGGDFAEAKASLVVSDIETRSRARKWPAVVGAGVVAFALGLALGWVAVSIPSQDANREAANAIAEGEARASALEAELDAANETIESLQAEPQDALVEEGQATQTPDSDNSGTSVEDGTTPDASTGPVLVSFPIRSGDTLWAIAERFLGNGERYPEILELNPGIDPRGLQPGDLITIAIEAADERSSD